MDVTVTCCADGLGAPSCCQLVEVPGSTSSALRTSDSGKRRSAMTSGPGRMSALTVRALAHQAASPQSRIM